MVTWGGRRGGFTSGFGGSEAPPKVLKQIDLVPDYHPQNSLTIPAGSVKSEKSALRRIFNYSRTKMGLNRLGNVSFFYF